MNECVRITEKPNEEYKGAIGKENRADLGIICRVLRAETRARTSQELVVHQELRQQRDLQSSREAEQVVDLCGSQNVTMMHLRHRRLEPRRRCL